MWKRECSLCGGKLRGNICTECGLDNSKSDENYRTSASHTKYERLTHVHESRDPLAGKTLTKEQKKELKKGFSLPENKSGTSAETYRYAGERIEKKPKSRKGGAGKLVAVFAIIWILLGSVGTIFEFIDTANDGWGTGYEEIEPEYDEDYDPYEFVEYELEETGESYEEILTAGNYVGGVHIPEGTYEVTLVDGHGVLTLVSDEHGIYIYENIAEEQYDEVVIEEFRVYAGSRISISESANLLFRTENAVLPIENMSNPNTESFKEREEFVVGEDIEPGVYDIHCVEGTGYFDYTIELDDGSTNYEGMYIGEEGNEYDYPATYKNVVLPEGTDVYIYEMTIELVPSEYIVDEEYLDYYR